MPFIRKRPAQAEASPSPPARRRRSGHASESEVGVEEDGEDYDDEGLDGADGSGEQMIKKLVRLALASEYSRQPLRRAEITAKVLAPGQSRAFKAVFEGAQACLKDTFGMTLTELPVKEKITVSQKRAAQRANEASQGSASASSKSYVLTSTLPPSLRTPLILPPPRMPSVGAEAGYVGLYTFIVSIIYLCQGSRISEGKLERYLKKCNADNYAPGGEKTEKVLKRMEKEGYIVKIKEREVGGEETVDWVVGPRGKVEIGEGGVAALVKGVYGKRDVEVEELEDKLEKSLGAGTFKRRVKRRGVSVEGETSEQEQSSHPTAEDDSPAARGSTRTRQRGENVVRERGRATQGRQSTRHSRGVLVDAEAEDDESRDEDEGDEAGEGEDEDMEEEEEEEEDDEEDEEGDEEDD